MTTGSSRPLEAIVFDFDGVLANTEPLHFLAFKQALVARGIDLDEREYYDRYLGYDDHGVLGALSADRELGWTRAEVLDLVREKGVRFRSIIETQPVLIEGVRERLLAWDGRVPMAIASGGLRDEIEWILRSAGLLGLFPVIVAAGETPNGKPAPDPYRAALECLGAAPSRSVAVEDSVWGIESARAAGMKVAAVTTSYPRERLTLADLVVGSVGELTLARLEELVPWNRDP